LDRISGVVGLAILAAVYFALISTEKSYSTSLLAAIIPALVIYYLFIKKIFPSFINAFTSTLLLGLIVQALQVLCAYCIMSSIQIAEHQSAYIFIFLLSSIVAILPFTIGGLGAREVVFLWGSNLFLLDKHQSIYISILFYLITVIVSFAGLRWVYKSPVESPSRQKVEQR
jgi:glycosyltransferase 2 family protein